MLPANCIFLEAEKYVNCNRIDLLRVIFFISRYTHRNDMFLYFDVETIYLHFVNTTCNDVRMTVFNVDHVFRIGSNLFREKEKSKVARCTM